MSYNEVSITNNLRGVLKVEPREAAGSGETVIARPGPRSLTISSGSSSSLSFDGLDSILFEALGDGNGSSASLPRPDERVCFSVDSTRVYTLSELEHNREWQLEFGESATEETTRTNVTVGQPEGEEESSRWAILESVSLASMAAVVSMAVAPELKELSNTAWVAISGGLAFCSIVTGVLSFSRAIKHRRTSLIPTGIFKRFKK